MRAGVGGSVEGSGWGVDKQCVETLTRLRAVSGC